MPELRDYQLEIIEQVERLDHPLIPLPTGGGKTVIAATIIEKAVKAQRQRVVFMVHRRELVTQASQKLLAVGVDHAILMGDESSQYIGQRCIVASVQTLHARVFRSKRLELPSADLLFVDEAHHSRAATYLQVRDAKRIGLTATPTRGDGRGLGGDLFTDLVRVPTYAWLIERGYLVRSIVYAPVAPDLRGVRTMKTGDYAPDELERRMDTQELVGGIVEHWHKFGDNRQTILFTSGIKHSMHLQREFAAADIPAAHLDCNTPIDQRKAILAAFRDRKIRILCNCMVLTEGFDEPSASCIVLARPTRLMPMYKQMVGRGLRPYPGKTDLVVLDHSGACYSHGLPDDEVEWTLDPDHQSVNRSALARANGHKRQLATCPRCNAVRLEGDPCRQCGWIPESKPETLEVREGELGRVERGRRATPTALTREEELAFYLELMGIAAQRRYKAGWAAHKFNERFGRFPPWEWNRAEPQSPSGTVHAWVRSRDIAYAKAMAARR